MTEQNSDNQSAENVHASLTDLMSIRDGDRSTAFTHVQQCEFCQARLEEVHTAARNVHDSMLFEAELPVPTRVWANIEAQLRANGISELEPHGGAVNTELLLAQQTVKKQSMWSSINTAIYSLAAAVMFTGLVSLYTFQGQQQSLAETQALQASIQSLMDNSRGLESVLQQAANDDGALAVSDQSLVERLQWRLMLVDQKIHESESSDDISYEQIKALWAERIDALTQLNQLYYTNQVAVNDGEIL